MTRNALCLPARAFFLAGVFCFTLFGRSGGPDPGLTGAPGDSTCAACHGSGTVNTGGGSLTVELLNASRYTPGATHRLRITLADSTAIRWGFQLSARRAADPSTSTGNLASLNVTEVFVQTSSGRQFINHGIGGTRPGQTASASWEIDWTAPATDVGEVTFYAAGNAANGNAIEDAGDKIYTTSLTVTAAGDNSDGTKSRVLPQFVHGEPGDGARWYSALYFTNSAGAPATLQLRYRSDAGGDLAVPGAPTTLNIPGNGTARVETPTLGAFAAGWVDVEMPDGVTGYGVFRQGFPGRADQEAVVPLSDDSKTAWTLIWDDDQLTTAVAVLNPGDTAVTVDITVRNTAGDTIGTSQLNLAARSKQAFVLRDRPGLAGMAGQRGSAEFRVPSGRLAVLGLRFGAEAFTSIPAAER